VVIITGANAGIGLETAKALVAMGADVIMGKESFTFLYTIASFFTVYGDCHLFRQSFGTPL
jgi:NADP-dependent 3-hydroxy acid dehydrogenase YdfG